MVAILMMLAKLATPDLFLKKVFINKGYDVIISVHDVYNKVLSRESSYIVDSVIVVLSCLQRFTETQETCDDANLFQCLDNQTLDQRP